MVNNKSMIMGPGGKPQPGIKINPDDCDEMFCTYCDSPSFITITRYRAVSVLLMPPAGGHLTLSTIHCSNCRAELDLKTAKKWAHLDKEGRAEAREHRDKAAKEKMDKGVGFKATEGVGFKMGG